MNATQTVEAATWAQAKVLNLDAGEIAEAMFGRPAASCAICHALAVKCDCYCKDCGGLEICSRECRCEQCVPPPRHDHFCECGGCDSFVRAAHVEGDAMDREWDDYEINF